MTGGAPAARVVLHVGLPKAASTALQLWADGARAALAARGVDYPDPDMPDLMRKHHHLVPQARQGRADWLAAAVAGCRQPVLFVSNEGLSARFDEIPPAGIAAIRAAIGARDLTLVMLTRDPEAWVRSLWAQAVLNPYPAGARPMARDLDSFARLAGVRHQLDHDRRAADMAGALGAREVVRADVGGDWLAAVLGALGTGPLPEAGTPARSHEAAPLAAIELVRRMNAQPVPPAGADRLALLAAIQAELGTANMTLANVSRKVRARDPDDRARLARRLGRILTALGPPRDDPAQAALHAALAARAAAGAAAFGPAE